MGSWVGEKIKDVIDYEEPTCLVNSSNLMFYVSFFWIIDFALML